VEKYILKRKEVNKIKIRRFIGKIKLWGQKGQSTLEYALVIVIAGIISAILIAVGKPIIIDVISKVFNKIASMV
jgi:Flp pilus assembly pilin Flp